MATIRAVAVTVAGDRDHASTSPARDPQARGYVNAPLAVTISSVMIAFFMIADEEIPTTTGSCAAIEVIAPEGSIVNPVFPRTRPAPAAVIDAVAALGRFDI